MVRDGEILVIENGPPKANPSKCSRLDHCEETCTLLHDTLVGEKSESQGCKLKQGSCKKEAVD